MDIGSLVAIIGVSLFMAWFIFVPIFFVLWYRNPRAAWCPRCHDILFPRWFERHICNDLAVYYHRRVAIARHMGIKPEQVSAKLLNTERG